MFWIGLIDSSNRECSDRCSKCNRGNCLECYYGYWGHNCQHECVNCWLGGCKKHSGRCEQCEPGRYGSHCNSQCSVNCRPSKFETTAHCQRHSGKCLDGCVKAWWGSDCQQRCSAGCQEACYQKDGVCIFDCRNGYYGTHCNMSCSEGCAFGTCDWLTGTCHDGCKCGYAGDKCEDVCTKHCKSSCRHDHTMNCLTCSTECKDGWIAPGCNDSCKGNCKVCDMLTGKCFKCRHGYYGNICDLKCSRSCIGSSCDVSGRCTEGCKDGYYGPKCHVKCPTTCETCTKTSKDCSLCKHGSAGTSCKMSNVGLELEDEGLLQGSRAISTDYPVRSYEVIQELIFTIIAACTAHPWY